MTRILYPEFRDQNDATKYPFGERVTLRNEAGKTLLEGSFLDAHLYPIGGQARLYLSRVVLTVTTITFTIGDENNPNLASGSYSFRDPQDNVVLTDSYNRPAGILISESARLAAFQAWGMGTFNFQIDQTEFAATCCLPTPEVGVRGILFADGTILSGQVWLVGSDGVVLRQDQVTIAATCSQAAQTLDVIRVDIVGNPLFRRRLCEDANLFDAPRPIRKLRIVNGDYTFETEPVNGQLTLQANNGLVPDPALRIRVGAQGITLEVLGSPSGETAPREGALRLPANYEV